MSLTIKDIARLCGVSIGTVDRALNGRAGVNERTKQKILGLASEYGYRPDLRARSLVTGKTMTVGVVVFNLRNYFFSQLVTAIDGAMHERGFSVYPAFTERDPEVERRVLSRLVSFNVDGIILFPVGRGREFEQFLKSLNTPVVCVGNRLSRQWAFAGIDDAAAEVESVRHIAERGYSNIVFAAPPLASAGAQNIFEVEQRYKGYVDGMAEFLPRVEPAVISGPDYIDAAVRHVRSAKSKPAFLCNSDIYALRLLKAFRNEGISVPRDAGLMGFDNIDILEFVRPALATVDYHIGAIGQAAGELLFAEAEATRRKTNRTRLITHTVIPGESL